MAFRRKSSGAMSSRNDKWLTETKCSKKKRLATSDFSGLGWRIDADAEVDALAVALALALPLASLVALALLAMLAL